MIQWLKNILSLRNTDIQKQKDIDDKIIPSESEIAHKSIQDYKELLSGKDIKNEDIAFMFVRVTDIVYKWVGENGLRFKFHERGEEHIIDSKNLRNQPHSRSKHYFEIFDTTWRTSDNFNLTYNKNEIGLDTYWYTATYRSKEEHLLSMNMNNLSSISKDESYSEDHHSSIKLFIDNMSKNKKKKMIKLIQMIIRKLDFYTVRQYFRFIAYRLNAKLREHDSDKKTKLTFWRYYELNDVLKYYTTEQVRQNKIKHLLKN